MLRPFRSATYKVVSFRFYVSDGANANSKRRHQEALQEAKAAGDPLSTPTSAVQDVVVHIHMDISARQFK